MPQEIRRSRPSESRVKMLALRIRQSFVAAEMTQHSRLRCGAHLPLVAPTCASRHSSRFAPRAIGEETAVSHSLPKAPSRSSRESAQARSIGGAERRTLVCGLLSMRKRMGRRPSRRSPAREEARPTCRGRS